LNIIEKKLDKDSGSSKSGSHRSPDKKKRTRSVIKHHHHSPRHYNKKKTSAQVHPLSGSIGGLGQMSYEEK
jgi:hypothetical protein